MQIDTTSLIAQMTYFTIKGHLTDNNIDKVENFQNMIKASSNSCANTSSKLILDYIDDSEITDTVCINYLTNVLVNNLNNMIEKNDQNITNNSLENVFL